MAPMEPSPETSGTGVLRCAHGANGWAGSFTLDGEVPTSRAIAVGGKNQRSRRVRRLSRRGSWPAPVTRGSHARPNNLSRRGLPSKFECSPRLELGSRRRDTWLPNSAAILPRVIRGERVKCWIAMGGHKTGATSGEAIEGRWL
jgi:hypothetical protein